jgi:hypothetical protein
VPAPSRRGDQAADHERGRAGQRLVLVQQCLHGFAGCPFHDGYQLCGGAHVLQAVVHERGVVGLYRPRNPRIGEQDQAAVGEHGLAVVRRLQQDGYGTPGPHGKAEADGMSHLHA